MLPAAAIACCKPVAGATQAPRADGAWSQRASSYMIRGMENETCST